MHPRAPTTAVYFSSPLPSISLLNRNQRNHDTQLWKTFPLQAQTRCSLGKMDKNTNGHTFFPSIIFALLSGLIGRSDSKWTKNKISNASQYKIHILRCVSPLHKAYYNQHFDRSVSFPTELRKGGSELDNLREVYTFSGHSAVWTKGVSLRCEKELLAWLQGARPGGEGPAVRRLVPFTLALISKPPFTASSALIHKSQGFTAARLINTGLQWFWTLPLLQDHLFIWK